MTTNLITKNEFTVTEISNLVKRNIEQNFSYVRVKGEISGLKKAPSGHVYLSVKDNNSVLAAICWRNIFDSLKFQPTEGMEVICIGSLTTFPGQSKYQLNIESFEHSGVGALMAMLEKRKKMFITEGLFDESHKKKIPLFPGLIGVVTSPTGAVIRDIIHRVSDRFPTEILVWPVLVQGTEADKQITAAIKGFNLLKRKPDIIIVARGGGSIEDLWCFNEENVIRAVFESKIPIISAVGHETDFTLIDFVADLRAPTPTAAAELAVPVLNELKFSIAQISNAIYREISRTVNEKDYSIKLLAKSIPTPAGYLSFLTQRLDEISFSLRKSLINLVLAKQELLMRIASRLRSPQNLVEKNIIRLDNLSKMLVHYIGTQIENKFRDFNSLKQLLASLSFENTLKRGFAIIRDEQTAKVIKSTGEIANSDSIEIEFFDGKKIIKISK